MPRSITALRLLTDHAIPRTVLPSGVHIESRVLVAPACEVTGAPPLYGEVYTRCAPGVDGESQAADESTLESTCSVVEGSKMTLLYAHGGAFCCCTSGTHRKLLATICLKSGCRIVAIDYRRPPEHPCPAARDDLIRAFDHLTREPQKSAPKVEPTSALGVAAALSGTCTSASPVEEICSGCTEVEPTKPKSVIFGGDSAGGGLCMSALVALRDRAKESSACNTVDEGGTGTEFQRQALLPAGAALISPWVDLGDDLCAGTFKSNGKVDFLPTDLVVLFANAYVHGQPGGVSGAAVKSFAEGEGSCNDAAGGAPVLLAGLRDPVASPAFADLAALPPLLIEVGGGEVLLGQIQAFAARANGAGTEIRLTVATDMVHVFPILDGLGCAAPAEAIGRICSFIGSFSGGL